MTPRQQRFVEQYLIDLNATQAAIRAGYSARSAKTHGTRLTRYPAVGAAIARGRAAQAAEAKISAKRVLDELALIAFADIETYVAEGPDGRLASDRSGWPREARRAVAEFVQEERLDGQSVKGHRIRRTKIKLYDKLRALELIARHLGMFAHRHGPSASGDAAAEIAQASRGFEARLAEIGERLALGDQRPPGSEGGSGSGE